VPKNTPIARRLPGFEARRATRRAQHMRKGSLWAIAVVVVVVLGAGGAVGVLVFWSSGHPPTKVAKKPPAATPVLRAAAAPWALRAPVADEVVLPGARGELVIVGGSTTGGQAASGIFTLDVATGALTHVENLRTVLFDAAGTVVGGQDLVFGGATPSAVASVESFTLGAAPAGAPTSVPTASVPTASLVGSLPEPRWGAASARIGATTYLCGGANGPTPDPHVLATADGQQFSVVATLPDPVLYPALAALGGDLYVFGGEALSGAGAGRPSSVIQRVNPTTHKVVVVGHLPDAVVGASAVLFDGEVFVFGGDTAIPSGSTSGAGATVTSPAIWRFDPRHASVTSAGRLNTPVSHAGVAVLGSDAWVVGGQSDGAPVSRVQTLSATAARAAA